MRDRIIILIANKRLFDQATREAGIGLLQTRQVRGCFTRHSNHQHLEFNDLNPTAASNNYLAQALSQGAIP